jgi:hypothetical protein
MALLKFSKRSRSNWTPASYSTDEIATVINVDVGDVVGAAFLRVRAAFNGSNADATMELGDGSDRNRFITTTEADVVNTGLKQGVGAGFTNTGQGYLYTAADTVDINLITDTANDGTTGEVDAWIYVAHADPH